MPRPDSWSVVPISFSGSGSALIRQLANRILWEVDANFDREAE